MFHHLTTPSGADALAPLAAGDTVLLAGVVYTARDAAHRRMAALLEAGKPLPFDPVGAVIYYTGPCPAPPGFPIGSCGPTTSSRMDGYAPRLLDAGLAVMIGKGARGPAVVEAIVRNGAVYLAAPGGAGALLAGCVRSCRVIAFPDLGAEAVHRCESRGHAAHRSHRQPRPQPLRGGTHEISHSRIMNTKPAFAAVTGRRPPATAVGPRAAPRRENPGRARRALPPQTTGTIRR